MIGRKPQSETWYFGNNDAGPQRGGGWSACRFPARVFCHNPLRCRNFQPLLQTSPATGYAFCLSTRRREDLTDSGRTSPVQPERR